MPEIKPFKAIRYNSDKIGKLADVICQPYDQISNRMEKEYKSKNPFNFVRLVLTKYSEGHDRPREYRDSRRFIEQWNKDGYLVQETTEAVYAYWQEFKIDNTTYCRKGFTCIVRLEELGKGNILPHEKTLSKPKADRLNLLTHTKADLEPVFLLYTDSKNKVNALLEEYCKEPPLIEVRDELQVNHKIWQITDADTITKVQKQLKNSVFVIADGHHRYETAFTYLNELGKVDENHPANYKMITLVNIEDPGLVILPTHRLIKGLSDFNLTDFLTKTEKYFDIQKSSKDQVMKDLAACAKHAFGFYSKQTTYILKLKAQSAVKEFLPDRSAEYQDLDVAILHTLLIENVLGITPEKIEDHVKYERKVIDTMYKVENGDYDFCFLLNPTRPEQVKAIAENKERMPQKSTDFYPKLISGLLYYPFE